MFQLFMSVSFKKSPQYFLAFYFCFYYLVPLVYDHYGIFALNIQNKMFFIYILFSGHKITIPVT